MWAIEFYLIRFRELNTRGKIREPRGVDRASGRHDKAFNVKVHETGSLLNTGSTLN